MWNCQAFFIHVSRYILVRMSQQQQFIPFTINVNPDEVPPFYGFVFPKENHQFNVIWEPACQYAKLDPKLTKDLKDIARTYIVNTTKAISAIKACSLFIFMGLKDKVRDDPAFAQKNNYDFKKLEEIENATIQKIALAVLYCTIDMVEDVTK